MSGILRTLLMTIILARPQALNAQTSTEQSAVPAPVSTGVKRADETKPASSSQKGQDGKITRWFELQTATLTVRTRFIETSQGITISNNLQHQEAFKARFKFDPKGNYSLHAGVFSGNHFIVGWSDTGLGTGEGVTNLYLKQLYLSAQPIKGLELQYGGLYFQRGESTEITSYDNDGYLVGERIILRKPKQFFFDEIAITYAYLGDLSRPNLNKRYYRLKQANYHQFLVSKKLGKRASMSAEYTFHDGRETMREAVSINMRRLRVIDSLHFENYQRMDVNPDYGFTVSGEKTLFKRLTLGGGYAQIDPNYGGLNGDRFNKGKRMFVTATFVISPEFSLSTFLTRAAARRFAVSNRTRFEVLFSYNLLKSLQRTGIF